MKSASRFGLNDPFGRSNVVEELQPWARPVPEIGADTAFRCGPSQAGIKWSLSGFQHSISRLIHGDTARMRHWNLGIALLWLAACSASSPPPPSPSQITVLSAKRIYTSNPQQ